MVVRFPELSEVQRLLENPVVAITLVALLALGTVIFVVHRLTKR